MINHITEFVIEKQESQTCRLLVTLKAYLCDSSFNFQNVLFSSLFDIDCKEVQLQLQMEFIDLQCSEDLKSKFLACHILNFYKNHVFPPGQFSHTQQLVRMFGSTYCYEQLFSKMKQAKSMLYLQL